MGLFGRKKESLTEYEDDNEIYDADEEYDLYTDSALFIEATPLRSTVITVYPRDIYRLNTDSVLENAGELPYDFRYYLDTRRAFSRALDSCREEITGFESYEGGRTADYSAEFDYDDNDVRIYFTLSRESDSAGYVFTARIVVNGETTQQQIESL